MRELPIDAPVKEKNMISRRLAEELIAVALSTGADFAEVYQENTRKNSLRILDGKVDRISDTLISGIGIRAFLGTKTVYASTSDISREALLRCAASVAAAINDGSARASIHLTEKIYSNVHPISICPSSADVRIKTELLREATDAASAYHESISQVSGMLLDVDHCTMVANSEGLYTENRSVRTRMAVNAIASANGENQSGSCAPGRGMGLEMFDVIIPREIGVHAAKQAVTNLGAQYCPAGQMTVAIENGFGGVIFHEACGHSLEATSVGIGMSEMAGKLGQQVANPKVTAIDDGTIPNAWGSINSDDEGNPSQRNVLIRNGILESYMIDRLGSRRLGLPMTGNSRREGYAYEPTSRMTNTFIDNGPDKNEDIIASIDYGLYAKEMGGGSVNPLTGAFNFAVVEGYIVRKGRICEAVRGASLIGTGSQILRDIDMVGQNLATGQGMCGSSSGSVPTDVGQPLIRVSKITVGGR